MVRLSFWTCPVVAHVVPVALGLGSSCSDCAAVPRRVIPHPALPSPRAGSSVKAAPFAVHFPSDTDRRLPAQPLALMLQAPGVLTAQEKPQLLPAPAGRRCSTFCSESVHRFPRWTDRDFPAAGTRSRPLL